MPWHARLFVCIQQRTPLLVTKQKSLARRRGLSSGSRYTCFKTQRSSL